LRTNEYNDYLDTMNENLKERVFQTDLYGQINYNMDDLNKLNTGNFIAAHAEIRALNNLAIQKFGTNYVDSDVFDVWLKNDVLGYNRNIQKGAGDNKVIMHTCADCFYILDLVTFIRL